MTGTAPRHDAGESLVELLMTVVILGIATAGIAAALLTVGNASQTHRRQVLAQNALRSWAEQMGTGLYKECATPADFAAQNPTLPTGYSATVTDVQFWNGAAFAPPPLPPQTCVDTGIQRVTMRITVPNGLSPTLSQSATVVVRKPCVSSC